MSYKLYPVVSDLLGLDHYAHLTARLNGKGFFYAAEAARDLLEPLQPFDICLKILAPCAGACGTYGVCRLNYHCNERSRLDVTVVSLYRMHDFSALFVLLGKVHTYLNMRPVYLVVYRFADVVQQSRTLSKIRVRAQFICHHARNERHLHRVSEHILTVASTVTKPPEYPDKLMVYTVDTRLKCGRFALFFDDLLDFFSCFLDHLFYP